MSRAWRLVVAAKPATGWWNMALDETLLEAAAAGAPPTLRLYAWVGPWLSLGYAQPFDAVAARQCRDAGVSVIRRITGGRAVLHGCDLTYAVTAHESALPPGLEASYRVVSDALIAALTALGVAAERAGRGPAIAPGGAFDCFASAAHDEIAVADRKLAGSAQRRAGGAVLQHGSIRIAADPPDAARVAGVGRFATSLSELGLEPGRARAELVRGLPKTLGASLGVEIERSPLRQQERRAAGARARVLRSDPLGRRAAAASRGL